MKKIFALLTFLILVGIFIPAVSAEIIIDEEINVFKDYSEKGHQDYDGGSPGWNANGIRIENIERYEEIKYVGFTWFRNNNALSEGANELTYTLNGNTNTCRIHIQKTRNALGIVTATQALIFFDNWDVGTLHGTQIVTFSQTIYNGKSWSGSSSHVMSPVDVYSSGQNPVDPRTCIIVGGIDSYNHLTVNDDGEDYEINLKREYDNRDYYSKIEVKLIDDIILSDYHHEDFFNIVRKTDTDRIEVTLNDEIITFPLGGEEPDDGSAELRVYVRNSQTSALLANSHIVISASVDNEFHEVINQTLPSGTYTGNLQPTGGGLPNPDFYRLIATAEGYNSIMPYIDFEVDGATTIYAYLDPVGGAPNDENNTFIDFFVRDMSANPISGATVNFGGYTLITNSAGYTIFEVDKSKTYSWSVSKSGYGSLTGNVVIGDDPRHTINTVLAPAVTPTTPTAIPTSTSISPTPTMTAPNGEPVSNWLEWFAAHFGMILGGGVEIGKIFMWLCFALPVGVYVGKEAKAGAAGFMAGAGVVTLFFVLIGWVPIWLLVFLALIIGLLYAKVFNNSDTGGGR